MSLLAITASGLLFLILESLFPYKKQNRIYPGITGDLLLYGGLQSIVIGTIISTLGTLLREKTGLGQASLMSNWSSFSQLLFFLVTHDFIMYWLHRWQHSSKVLWIFHEAHHSPENLNWISGIRSHPLEMLLLQSLEFLPIYLLGANPEVAVYKAIIDAIIGQWIHSNVRLSIGPLKYIFNSPELHKWHHVDEHHLYHKNFSTKLSIWDALFGTLSLPNGKAENYGLKAEVRKIYPVNSYWGQVIWPFTRKRHFK